MTWTRYDWLSRGLLLLGMWFIASGTAGLLVPRRFPETEGVVTAGMGLSAATAVVGVGAVLAGFYLFARHVEDDVNLALSAREVAERWEQR